MKIERHEPRITTARLATLRPGDAFQTVETGRACLRTQDPNGRSRPHKAGAIVCVDLEHGTLLSFNADKNVIPFNLVLVERP